MNDKEKRRNEKFVEMKNTSFCRSQRYYEGVCDVSVRIIIKILYS